MKKIIRLSESELVKVIHDIVSEANFRNQSEVDVILDKISKSGMDSLTDKEKQILQSPDDDTLSTNENPLEYVKNVFVESGIVGEDNIEFHEEDGMNFMEINNINSVKLDFFSECDGVLKVSADWDEVGKVYNVHIGAWGPEQCIDERVEVYEYFHEELNGVLADYDILVWFDDFDEDINNMYNFGAPI